MILPIVARSKLLYKKRDDHLDADSHHPVGAFARCVADLASQPKLGIRAERGPGSGLDRHPAAGRFWLHLISGSDRIDLLITVTPLPLHPVDPPPGGILAALRDTLKILLPQKSVEEIITAIEQEYRACAASGHPEHVVDLVRRKLEA